MPFVCRAYKGWIVVLIVCEEGNYTKAYPRGCPRAYVTGTASEVRTFIDNQVKREEHTHA